MTNIIKIILYIALIFVVVVVCIRVINYIYPLLSGTAYIPGLLGTGIIASFSTFISLNNSSRPSKVRFNLFFKPEAADILFDLEVINDTDKALIAPELAMDNFIVALENEKNIQPPSKLTYSYRAQRNESKYTDIQSKKRIKVVVTYRLHGNYKATTETKMIRNPFYYK